MACREGRAEGNISHGSSWRVKEIINKQNKMNAINCRFGRAGMLCTARGHGAPSRRVFTDGMLSNVEITALALSNVPPFSPR